MFSRKTCGDKTARVSGKTCGDKTAQVSRKIRLKMHRHPADGMGEFQFHGMQGLPGEQVALALLVQGITDHGMPDPGHVDADLVRPAGVETDGQGSDIIVLHIGKLPEMGYRPLSARKVDAAFHQGGRASLQLGR